MSITKGHCRSTPTGVLVMGSCDYYYFHWDTQREPLRWRGFSSHVTKNFSLIPSQNLGSVCDTTHAVLTLLCGWAGSFTVVLLELMLKISSVICKCQWKLKTVQATWDISRMTGMVYWRGRWMWVDIHLKAINGWVCMVVLWWTRVMVIKCYCYCYCHCTLHLKRVTRGSFKH